MQYNLFLKFHCSDNMQHAYWELKREMSNLHLVTQVQAELLRKLKTSAAVKKGKYCWLEVLSPARLPEEQLATLSYQNLILWLRYAVSTAHPFHALASVSSWSASHIKVLLVFFLQYYILFPLWLLSAKCCLYV